MVLFLRKYACSLCGCGRTFTRLRYHTLNLRLRAQPKLEKLCAGSVEENKLIKIQVGTHDGKVRKFSASSNNCSKKSQEGSAGGLDLSEFPAEYIRNFSIVAHVDHGKSTLADRLLELTSTISKTGGNEQVLDKLQVERERGITVKAQTASMFYQYKGKTYLLNLIDTPGHVDFNYEVSRSLSACQGVLLLVDANSGVQAQTVANFYLAFEADLAIIPVINKIDLKVANPEAAANQMRTLFDIADDDILRISAKLGTGVDDILPAVIERIKPPVTGIDQPLKMLLFDSWFDRYRGAIANVALIDGKLSKGDKITSGHSNKTYQVQEVGIMHPNQTPVATLYAGQVGYFISGMHNIKEAHIGDTFYRHGQPVALLPGFKAAKPMVFAGIYPMDQSEYNNLRSAIDRLTLNDSSVSVSIDSSLALGQGWRLGFLGLLHLDVFNQRLEQEYNANVIVTVPSVPYKAKLTQSKANRQLYGNVQEITVYNPSVFPDRGQAVEYLEPMIIGTIISPEEYATQILHVCLERRGEQLDYSHIDNTRVLLKYKLPLNEVVVDFFDVLKSVTSGYASFDYEDAGYQAAELVKLSILLNGQEVNELAMVVHKDKAREVGKRVCATLKETIPRQLFEVAVQAAIGKKILARENVKAVRKNVLAKCYGGDVTRKAKLLRRQAEGKKRLRKFGNVEVPKEAFISVLKR
ncbi:translation factor Guf1, mitochondrial-like [Amphiura filiformis]|uniref:translation factor Guf1, mitochondrial-like n=1 Tax=Amphiura filiformis TaxID=82378 RepID=UPI003B22283B